MTTKLYLILALAAIAVKSSNVMKYVKQAIERTVGSKPFVTTDFNLLPIMLIMIKCRRDGTFAET